MTQINGEIDSLREIATYWLKRIGILMPVVVGVGHQIIMALFNIDRIYVFINPPEYIYPWLSLEFSWWFLLVIVSSGICFMAASERLDRIPTRIALPFYTYLLFLLILVKPV